MWIYGLEIYSLMKKFGMKLAKILTPQNTWPICDLLEEDMILRSDFWNMSYQNERFKKWDNTDIKLPKTTDVNV